MSDPHALTLWAKIQSELDAAKDVILKQYGLDWKSFKQVERDAMDCVGADPVETEYGIVQTLEKGQIQWVARRSAIDFDDPKDKMRLKLLKAKDERA